MSLDLVNANPKTTYPVTAAQKWLLQLSEDGGPPHLLYDADRLAGQHVNGKTIDVQRNFLSEVLDEERFNGTFMKNARQVADQKAYHRAFHAISSNIQPIRLGLTPGSDMDVDGDVVSAPLDPMDREASQQCMILLKDASNGTLTELHATVDLVHHNEAKRLTKPRRLDNILHFLEAYVWSIDFYLSTNVVGGHEKVYTNAVEVLVTALSDYCSILRWIRQHVCTVHKLCEEVLSMIKHEEDPNPFQTKLRADAIKDPLIDGLSQFFQMDVQLREELRALQGLFEASKSDVLGSPGLDSTITDRLRIPSSTGLACEALFGPMFRQSGLPMEPTEPTEPTEPNDVSLLAAMDLWQWCAGYQGTQDTEKQIVRQMRYSALAKSVACCIVTFRETVVKLININNQQQALLKQSVLNPSEWESWKEMCLKLEEREDDDLKTLLCWHLNTQYIVDDIRYG